MRSSVHIDNKEKNTLIPGRGQSQGLDDTTLSAEAPYSVNFSRSNRKFCLSLTIEAIAFYLLMLQKYISSIQNILQ